MTLVIDRHDGLSSRVAVKGACKAATTANVTLVGEQTIDGVSCVTGDRVLVKNQSTASENGVWIVDTGPWGRSKDFSRNDDVKSGTRVLVVNGSSNAGSEWYISTADPIVVGTTSLTFTQRTQALNDGTVTPAKLATASDFGDVIGTTTWTGEAYATLKARSKRQCHIMDFEDADPTGANDSSSALVNWITQAQTARVAAVLGGDGNGSADFILEEELEITAAGQRVVFENTGGYGYGEEVGRVWTGNTRLIASGTWFSSTGKRVRTRRNFRANSGAAQDTALSAVINIQAPGVQLEKVCVWLDVDYTNMSHTNLGANVDCGIFVGSRVGVQMRDPMVIGYFRRAGIYFDVTHGQNLPRHLSKAGSVYPDEIEVGGADGTHLINPFTFGPRVGVGILGARPKSGATDYGDPYYDQQLATTVTDRRGSFGFSDFLCLGGRIYGPDHHSNRRLYDPNSGSGSLNSTTMLAESDTAPAALHIDGLAGNASTNIWGMRFFGTRIATFEAFRTRLDQASRVMFFGCHMEGRNGGRTNTSGASIDTNDYVDHSYGDVAGTTNTDRVTWVGCVRQSFADGAAPHFYGPTFHLQTDSGRLLNKGGFYGSGDGEADIRGAAGYGVRFRSDNSTVATIDSNGLADFAEGIQHLASPQGNEVTIASGQITVTHSFHRVDTEGDASADDLHEIDGGRDGMRVVLRSASSSRDIVVHPDIDAGGNLKVAGATAFTLATSSDTVEFIYDEATGFWYEISRALQ